jgi:hypothetical protein
VTTDLFALTIVLDTSALKGSGLNSAPFQVLRGLAQAGLVRMLIPEIAVEEFRTQWRDRTKNVLEQAGKALKALSSESLLSSALSKESVQLSQEIESFDLEEKSKEFIDLYLASGPFFRIPLTLRQAGDAWAR